MEKEESRKIKRKMRGVWMGNVCGGEKSREKKKKKEKKRMDARKVGIIIKKIENYN